MTSFLKSLDEELGYLTRLESELDRDPLIPKRYAITVKHGNNNDYYWDVTTTDGKKDPKFVGEVNSEKLYTVARSSYKKELLKIVRHNLKILRNAAKGYRSYSKAKIIATLSPCLQELDFDTNFDNVMKELWEWAAEDYERNPKPFKDPVIIAKDGTRVRSKSECIIYNLLLELGIPFRYDPVMKFKIKNQHGEVETYYESPDFLIKCPDGSYIIIEHAGMLTSAQYTNDLAHKLQIYQLNGYWIGRSLFVTSDDIYGGIDSEQINNLLSCLRLRFTCL